MNGRRLSRKFSIFSSKVPVSSTSDQASPVVMPKLDHLDELMIALRSKWAKYQMTSRPTEALISIVGEYIAHAQPFFTSREGELASRWRQFTALVKEIELIISNEENVRPERGSDVDLIKSRDDYFNKWQKDIADYQLKSAAHQNNINILGSQIQDINEQITDVRAKQVLDDLRLLKAYQVVHQEIDEQLQKIETATLDQGCFSCWPSNEMKRMYAEVERLEAKRRRFKTTVPTELRECLVEELQAKIVMKRAEQEKLIQNPPLFNHDNENAYHRVAAKAETEKFDALCQISQPLMLAFIRLYFVAKAVSDLVPVKITPVLVSESAPLLSNEVQATSLADLKPLFQQLVSDLNNNLTDFYCMTPGRYDYQNYLDLFNKLRPELRAAIIEKGASASLDAIRQIFPRFESDTKQGMSLRI